MQVAPQGTHTPTQPPARSTHQHTHTSAHANTHSRQYPVYGTSFQTSCGGLQVALDDDLADKLAPSERATDGSLDEEARQGALRRVAKAARKQGMYALAARKYTQVRLPTLPNADPRHSACM